MPARLQYNLDITPESQWNTISATALAKSALIYAQEVGDFFAGPDYYTIRDDYASYLITVTIDGCGQLEYNGEAYLLPPGHFFFVDCKKGHYYRTAPGYDSWHTMWVHCYGANSKTYYDSFLTHNNSSHIGSFHHPSKVVGIFTELLKLNASGQNQVLADFQAAALLTQLLSECIFSVMSAEKNDDAPQVIQRVRMHLLNHYLEKNTLNQLGEMFNLNPYYLQKQFKRYFGMSPISYQIFLRMTKAKELIRNTKMPIGEVALAVGIENLGYFTRQFKRQEGVTPQEYRKLWPITERPFPETAFSDHLESI